MYVEQYRICQDCGRDLDRTTTYRQHAYCVDCSGHRAV